MELNSRQRSYLTRKSHSLKPVVYIGKNGIGENTIGAVDQALAHHELVKIKFVDLKDVKEIILNDITQATGSVIVRLIGNIGLVYRENPDKKAYSLPE